MAKSLLLALAGVSALAVSCSSTRPNPVRTFPMGDRVTLGHLIYTVFETQWLTQIGEGAAARIPQQRFFLLRMSITNSGADEVLAPNLALVDDSGQSYAELNNGEGVPKWIGYLRPIKPAESAQGDLLFDVPPKHYKLRISDESEQIVALVDIPLSFGAETPEVPLPGSAAGQK
jgi:hypothetical protein